MSRTVPAHEAARLVAAGATLVDIREPAEHARERIAEAVLCPLSARHAPEVAGEALVFHCRSGMRTAMNLAALEAIAGERPWHVMQGGLDAWRKAGLPVEVAARPSLWGRGR